MSRFSFKIWYTHKILDVKIITKTELEIGENTDVALAKCVAALTEVVKNPDDWVVWE